MASVRAAQRRTKQTNQEETGPGTLGLYRSLERETSTKEMKKKKKIKKKFFFKKKNF